ncbi:hypothetical protein CAMRE0001_0315 [Campylobacter rectus RM3267]|uniref:Uncharacterized protein n=1 Tax=Campylobacter rectus RM3267 TaxID=553218 RepID=B9CYA5_CAMRE|nr:hypothetical protein CAMRE0001_0315 [Campylobacter rectus RM3267]
MSLRVATQKPKMQRKIKAAPTYAWNTFLGSLFGFIILKE